VLKEIAMSGIEGKVVAITGASSGIGEATALLLAARGARVVLGARRVDKLQELAARIEAAGGQVRFREVDVTKREDVARLVDAACEHFGRLDVLVNNAGVAPISPLDDLKVEDWEAMIDVNVKGPLFGIAAALPVFRRQKSGHFVNLLSTAGLIIKPTMAVYAGSKQAMRAISEGLRQEAGPNLRVTNISPGFVQTGLADSMTDPKVKASTEKSMHELAITPDAIARAIAFAIDNQPRSTSARSLYGRPLRPESGRRGSREHAVPSDGLVDRFGLA
jgi:NADP-dependent 3-hydroxy acid dehydrogenase YdfG